MTNTVIIGVGELAEFSKHLLNLKANDIFNIKYFCDPFNSENTGKLCDIDIIRLDDLKNKYLKWEIDCVIIADTHFIYRDLTSYLNSIGLRQVYVIPEYAMNIWLTHKDKLEVEDFIFEVDISKPCLRYYEFHVCDHCNLRCKGCGHVSNISEEKNADLSEYINDMKRLKELFWGCQSIKLLGGEPLLNNQLPEFVTETRNTFPEADIYIGTNGILIPKMDDILFEVMKKNNVWFMISSYPPTLSIKNQIEEKLNSKEVKYVFTPNITEFCTHLYLENKSDINSTYEKCKNQSGYCFTLREGKISPCITFYTHELNRKFNINYKILEGCDYFNLYEEQDGWELDSKLHKPIPFCAYCGENKFFEWKSINPKSAILSDYVNV